MKLLSVIFTLALFVGGCTTFEIGGSREATKVALLKMMGPNTTQVVSFDNIIVDDKGEERLEGAGAGTGFILKYKNRKYVITNAHVCGSSKRQVRLYLNRELKKFFRAKIVGYDDPLDLCMLESEFINLGDGIELGDERDIRRDEIYGTVGGNGLSDAQVPQTGLFLKREIVQTRFDESVDLELLNLDQDEKRASLLCAPPSSLEKQFHPLIPGLWRFICVSSELQDVYDFHIFGGSSGSAVINLRTGKLVGVISQFVHMERHYGGAIPLESVKLFLERNIK